MKHDPILIGMLIFLGLLLWQLIKALWENWFG